MHPVLGLFYVRANDGVQASQSAAGVTRDPTTGSTEVQAYRGPDGSWANITDINDMQAGAQMYDARGNTGKWIGNWKKSSYSDWFNDKGNFKFTYEDTTSDAADEVVGPTGPDIKVSYSPTGLGGRDAGTAEDSLDFADPIAGFLKGLGFNFDQAAGAARDFLQRQGALGAGTFAAQEAANVFGNAGMEGPNQRFDTQQQFGANLGDWGSIGTRALKNLKTLSGLGTEFASPENQQRRYFNPFNSGELDDRGIASQLTAALQGSGVSSLYNRGVSPSDVARMFTTFAGQNPGIANAGEGLDENFLNYAAGQFGLDRFFS